MPTKKAARSKKNAQPSFEQAMEELESLLGRLENESVSLDESLQLFERGMALKAICEQSLQDVEQRVRVLTEKTVQGEAKPFAADD